jgi:hypothetical protein
MTMMTTVTTTLLTKTIMMISVTATTPTWMMLTMTMAMTRVTTPMKTTNHDIDKDDMCEMYYDMLSYPN